jgi:hypothetical protein
VAQRLELRPVVLEREDQAVVVVITVEVEDDRHL